jgi:hypothetical protein
MDLAAGLADDASAVTGSGYSMIPQSKAKMGYIMHEIDADAVSMI